MAIKIFGVFFFARLLASPILQGVNLKQRQMLQKLPKDVSSGLLARMFKILVMGILFHLRELKPSVSPPKNSANLVQTGKDTEMLVGTENDGELPVNVIAVTGSVHLPFDHRMLVQNITILAFNNATVPPSKQATFPCTFAVSKYLQPGTFDLVGIIVYEIDQHPYQTTFYNGTIEAVEAGGFLSVESVFLVTLGVALLVLLGLRLQGQFQHFSKKTKRSPKVEVGTGSRDASLDEWLQVSTYASYSFLGIWRVLK